MRDPGAAWGPVGGRSTNPAAAGSVSRSPKAAFSGGRGCVGGEREEERSSLERRRRRRRVPTAAVTPARRRRRRGRNGMKWSGAPSPHRNIRVAWTLGGWLASCSWLLAPDSRLAWHRGNEPERR